MPEVGANFDAHAYAVAGVVRGPHRVYVREPCQTGVDHGWLVLEATACEHDATGRLDRNSVSFPIRQDTHDLAVVLQKAHRRRFVERPNPSRRQSGFGDAFPQALPADRGVLHSELRVCVRRRTALYVYSVVVDEHFDAIRALEFRKLGGTDVERIHAERSFQPCPVRVHLRGPHIDHLLRDIVHVRASQGLEVGFGLLDVVRPEDDLAADATVAAFVRLRSLLQQQHLRSGVVSGDRGGAAGKTVADDDYVSLFIPFRVRVCAMSKTSDFPASEYVGGMSRRWRPGHIRQKMRGRPSERSFGTRLWIA